LDYLDVIEGSNINVYIPSKDYYKEVLSEYWRYSWKSVLIPHTSYSKNKLVDVELDPAGTELVWAKWKSLEGTTTHSLGTNGLGISSCF